MKRFLEFFMVFLLSTIVRVLRLTYRVKINDQSGIFLSQKIVEPCVVTVWHNRLLFTPALLKRRFRSQISTISSLSDDGRYAELFANNFGIKLVRGSSSRGGARALIQLVRKLKKEKMPLAITIDGPRGPQYSCQPGALYLAASTGYPIYPYLINANRYFQLKNWDKTQIPKPFAKIDVIVGEPIFLPKDISEEGMAKAKKIVIDAMLSITVDKEQP